jgi:hypothetical protein
MISIDSIDALPASIISDAQHKSHNTRKLNHADYTLGIIRNADKILDGKSQTKRSKGKLGLYGRIRMNIRETVVKYFVTSSGYVQTVIVCTLFHFLRGTERSQISSFTNFCMEFGAV